MYTYYIYTYIQKINTIIYRTQSKLNVCASIQLAWAHGFVSKDTCLQYKVK